MSEGTFLRRARLAAPLAAALILAHAAGAQTIDPANEGYDPMRQISTQFVRPNILLVFDVSGSMAWDEISQHSVGTDQTGSWLNTVSWAVAGSGSCSGSGANTKCKTWTATLTVQQTHPSRMAKVKNALGNSMTIITPWTPPGGTCTDSARQWPALASAWSGATGPTQTVTTSGTPWIWKFAWAKTTSSAAVRPAGNPFIETGLVAQPPTIGCDCALTPPTDLVGKSANTVNWGLEIFSGSAADCDQGTLVIAPDSTDSGDVTALEACLKPNSVSTVVNGTTYKGLFADSGTPTKGALVYAASVITAVAGGGSVTNAAGSYSSSLFPTSFKSKTFSITADRKLSCGRVYAAILVTDGLSNNCNPNGGNWADPCTTTFPCPGTGCPDGGSSGYTCPNPYPTAITHPTTPLTQQDAFIGEKTDALWWLTAAGRRLYTRTWVIGVSDQVGPCELNYAAYRGRTDANSPNGDAGFDFANDDFLPEGTPGNYDSQSCTTRQPPHGSYAYFATTAKALQQAFSAIIAAVGTGDYTTSAPSVTASPLVAEGLVGFVASATYPKWEGHLYAYDIKADCSDTTKWDCTQPCGWVDPADANHKSNCLWDAGEILNVGALNVDGTRKGANNGLTRSLYTWDPASGYALVPIDSSATTAATLDTLCGNCGITAAVADFMLGNNGSGSWRPWQLGAVINSTQAVIGPALLWKQGLLASHSDFETTYQKRHPVVWAGASDGFTHGIDAVDGAELVAVIPPEQLAKQVTLYNTYLTKPNDFITGEPKLPDQHIFGVANSPRFADVWFDSTTEYKTLLFMTQGLGGTGVAAIDVTHPFPGRDYNGNGNLLDDNEAADPNYGFGITASPPPIQVVWSKNRNDLTHLGNTWSVPALGASSAKTWQLIMGAGFDGTFSAADTDVPYVYRLNPVDGTSNSVETLSNVPSGAYVRNQSFADAVIWQTSAPFFQPDNLVNQGIQVDLNGQFWVFEPNNWNASRLFNLGSQQPLYYPPAVAAYPANASQTHLLYAFASGTFYEKSPNVTGKTSTFRPTIYIGVKTKSTGTASFSGVQISSIPKPTGQSGFLGARTQVTAPPIIFVAKQGSTADPFALFLVYDPDAGACVGTSYIIRVAFTPTALSSIIVPADQVYAAGAGASAGFAVAGEKVVVSRSYVGQNGRAFIQEVPNLRIKQGGLNGDVSWWLELQ